MPSLKTWLMAIRPKTLPAAIAPVLIGTAMAFGDGVQDFVSATVCLIGALAIQIGTNLANDYYDFKKGADTGGRLGPTRVTQAGLIKPQNVKKAFIISFFIAVLASLYLIGRGGWPIAVIAIVSILSGILYTAGPWPLGYLGLGEIFVFIFFGPVAVGGTYYVQSFEINPAIIVAGFAPGLLSMAVLVVNNLRDIETDRAAGKRTLAVRFGKSFVMTEYLFSVIAAALIPGIVYLMTDDYFFSMAAILTIFFAIPAIKTVLVKSDDAPALNRALSSTGILLLIYSVLFSLGWIL